MVRIFVRRTNDVRYFTHDRARELEGLRDGGPGWWLRGSGDTSHTELVAQVLTSTSRATVTGYDVVVAAPRPISILVALDPDRASEVIRAHRSSVRAAVQYLEERALVVPERRRDETIDRPARWETIVGFTHGINRQGEPHLHDHVLVGARPADAQHVLDGRALFVHAPAADALYRAALRYELAERTPWRAWRSFRGVEQVAGLDEGYRVLWGGHHDERGEKIQWERADVVAHWRDAQRRFESHGTVPSPTNKDFDEHAFAGAFEGRIAVARRHVVTAWSNAAVYGQDPTTITKAIDQLLPSLRESRGVRETTVGVPEVRMVSHVLDHGPRPTRAVELDRWIQRSRERSSGVDRSRGR